MGAIANPIAAVIAKIAIVKFSAIAATNRILREFFILILYVG